MLKEIVDVYHVKSNAATRCTYIWTVKTASIKYVAFFDNISIYYVYTKNYYSDSEIAEEEELVTKPCSFKSSSNWWNFQETRENLKVDNSIPV